MEVVHIIQKLLFAMNNIDWNKLRDRGDERLQFEHFCYHVASRLFDGFGTMSYFYDTPGSEFYFEFNKAFEYEGIEYNPGDIIGWQAKFWKGAKDENNSPLDSKHRDELIEGFKKSRNYRPAIKLWIVCTPGSFVQNEWDKLIVELKKEDANCKFASWHKDIFEDFYMKERELYNSIFQFYFGEGFIDKKILLEISQVTLIVLNSKYDVDVHTPSDFEKSIVDIIDGNDAANRIRQTIKLLKKRADEDKKKPILNDSHWGYEYLTEQFREYYITDCKARYNIIDEIYTRFYDDNNIVEASLEIEVLLYRYCKEREIRRELLNQEIRRIFDTHKQYPNNVRDYLGELLVRIRNLECKLTRDPEYSKDSLSIAVDLVNKKILPVFAAAGYGKTHFACSLADYLIKKELPVLFFTGGTFRDCLSCESKIREKLCLPESMGFDDVLDSLDFLAETTNCRLPIIIDGLNETAPHEDRWREELPSLCRKISKRKNIMLITTCRDKSDYIETIYGLKTYKDVEDYIILDGIKKEDLETTFRRYLTKYDIKNVKLSNISVFENPLLLKIFCLANRGKENIEVNEYSLVSCMEAYSNQLIESITINNGRSDKITKHKLEKKMNDVSFLIWQKNDRCLDFYEEFANNFDDHMVNKILEEGLCFTLDKSNDDELIQFTYDMVAGYHIAKSILDSCKTKESFESFIGDSSDKLFGETKHTLAEDIIKSLFYLVPKKYGKEWFEISKTDDITKASFENLDILLSSGTGRVALISFLTKADITSHIAEYTFDALCKRILANNIESFSLFVPFFLGRSQKELDLYWNSKFATYPDLQNAYGVIHDKFLSDVFCVKDRFVYATMMCGITDLEFRQKFYRYLSDLILDESAICIECCKALLGLDDPIIKEIIISLLTCAGLRLKDKSVLRQSVLSLESLILNSKTTNVVLLDDLETLYSYGENHYGLEFDRTLLYKNSDVYWPVNKVLSLSMYSVYGYDFDKYNIRPLYQSDYNRPSLYSEQQIYGMLGNRILANGYDETIYNDLSNQEYEATKYRHEYKCSYAFKFGRDALLELYGWLLLNGKLPNAFKSTFRSEIISIDPSCPKFTVKRTLVSKFLLPKSIDCLKEWINESALQTMKDLTVCKLPGRIGEWVLLRGYFTQRMEERFANVYLSCTSQLVPKETRVEDLENFLLHDESEYNHAFANELGWRKLEFPEDDSNYDDGVRLMTKYCFSSWSRERFEYRDFSMLSTEIALRMGLLFDMDKMAYTHDGEEASAYFVNDSNFFFYMRRDVVDKILDAYGSKIRHHFYERRMIDNDLPKSVTDVSNRFKQVDEDVFYTPEE